MEMLKQTSKEIFTKAKLLMPGGVSSPVRALKSVGGVPLFVTKAKGAYLYDVDSIKYLDLCMSFGPLILGHANSEVIKNIELTLRNGTSFGTSTPGEVELAEKICQSHPSLEWVRFVNSGTEAVMSAIRLARAYTKRDIIIKFDGGYHGHSDSMLVKAGSGLATFGINSSHGVPLSTAQNTIVLPLGNIKAIIDVFNKFPGQIAAVIIEGIPANNGLLIQTKEFMNKLEDLCHSANTLLILDEVITGFRLSLGGAAEYYGISPDIVTLGKIIGGGLPVGAYGGKRELIELIAPNGPVYQAGTLSGNPVVIAAGNATLDILMNTNVYNKLERYSEKISTAFTQAMDQYSQPITIRRMGSIIWPVFENNLKPVSIDQIPEIAIKRFKKFHFKALKQGIYLPPSAFEVAFVSIAHDDEVIDDFTYKLEEVVKIL